LALQLPPAARRIVRDYLLEDRGSAGALIVSLVFQLQRLAELPLAAIVVEARYSVLFKLEHVNGNWLADQLTRLA
jgi:hypothetical protein